jgi:hypothetical protein
MRSLFRCALITVLLQFTLYLPCSAQEISTPPSAATSKKKLIEFGWDMPNAFYVAQHVRQMERLPFDGLVLSARYFDAALGKTRLFHDQSFGKRKFTWAELEPTAQALAKTKFVRFTDNFLRFNVSPADIDWFDDFQSIVHNSRLAARVARQGKIKGILLDLEHYKRRLFEYPQQKYRLQHSFAEYQDQVRLRAEQMMRAFQREAPNLTIFLTISYDQAESDEHSLSEWKYGLLPSFLDGLFAAAEGSTQIVDGFEAAYGFAREAQFAAAHRKIHLENRSLTRVPALYAPRISAAFGLWMDYESNKRPWNLETLDANYFTPEKFSSALKHALSRSDRYVWVYTEQPAWWTNERLPVAYVEAIRRTRRELGMRE